MANVLNLMKSEKFLTRNIQTLECWFHNWETGGFLEQYSNHLMNASARSDLAKCDIRCCETNYLGQIFCNRRTEPILHGRTCTNKWNKIWLALREIHIPYRGASPSYRSPVVWKDWCQTVVGVGFQLRTQSWGEGKVGKSGPAFSWPIRSQNSVITCSNHMLIGKTWMRCPISVLCSTMVEK